MALLAPHIGDAGTVAFIGLCKNAGKTTAMCKLMEELGGERLALTSVGRDGERTDVVTGTEKPEIWVPEGTLFATARGMLPLCDATISVEASTDVMTPLGGVAVFRAISEGYIQLAGPSAVGQLGPLSDTFRALGATRVIIDGAAGRKSLAGAEPGVVAVLCVGASMEGGIAGIVTETAYTCRLFAAKAPEHPKLKAALEHVDKRYALFTPEGEELELPMENGGPSWKDLPMEKCVLWIEGGVTTPTLRVLARRGAPILIASPDATHFLADNSTSEVFWRGGSDYLVRHEIKIAAVTCNPWSAYGKHVDGPRLRQRLEEALDVPVVNVKEAAE